VNELQAGVEFPFTVLPQPSALFLPCEGAFDDPAFGQYRKGVPFITLDDLNSGFQALHYGIGKGLPGIAAIDQHAFHSLQIRLAAGHSLQSPLRSVTSAVVIAMAWGSPCVSTLMCRLMPDTFLPASYPLCSALSVFITLCA